MPMGQVEYDEEAFIPLRARLIAILDGLRPEHPSALGEHCYRAIRRAVSRARLLPPDAATFQRWFRAACRRADGIEYSHSQRALFVRQFDAVGRRWAGEQLVGEPLQVTNYRRRRPGGVADPDGSRSDQGGDLRCPRTAGAPAGGRIPGSGNVERAVERPRRGRGPAGQRGVLLRTDRRQKASPRLSVADTLIAHVGCRKCLTLVDASCGKARKQEFYGSGPCACRDWSAARLPAPTSGRPPGRG